jgi:hypothetical protein
LKALSHPSGSRQLAILPGKAHVGKLYAHYARSLTSVIYPFMVMPGTKTERNLLADQDRVHSNNAEIDQVLLDYCAKPLALLYFVLLWPAYTRTKID